MSKTNSGREHQRDEAYREWIREQPCESCGGGPPCDPAHARSWGAGHGDWLDGDGNLLPLCRDCHRLQHDIGVDSFRDMTGVDVTEAARRWGERFREAS